MSSSSFAGETNLTVVTASEQLNRRLTQRFLVIADQHGNQSLAAFGASTIGNDDGKNIVPSRLGA